PTWCPAAGSSSRSSASSAGRAPSPGSRRRGSSPCSSRPRPSRSRASVTSGSSTSAPWSPRPRCPRRACPRRSSGSSSRGPFARDARLAAARAEAKDVEREVAAQIDKFERLVKRAPTHLDSHHRVGLHAPVAGVVLAAARRLGIPVRRQDAAARARARSAGLRTPDHFFGESGPGAYWSLARTLAQLRALPPGVSEFMTHPGWCDDALAYSRYGRQRETELVSLGTPAARAAALALGLTLCHFGDL